MNGPAVGLGCSIAALSDIERAVLATLDFAFTAEDRSFTSPEVRANLDRYLKRH